MKFVNSSTLFNSILVTCLCACSLSFADEESVEDNPVIVNSTEETTSEETTSDVVSLQESEDGKEYAPINFKKSYARMVAEIDEESHQQPENISEEEDVFMAGAVAKSFSKGYEEDQEIPDHAYPGIFHYWTLCPTDKSWLMIEDESVWFIEFLDRAKISNWFSGYALIIRPNNWWDSNKFYRFQLYNTVTKEAVQVNIDRGPLLGGSYTRAIQGFLTDTYHVQLSDGSLWRIKSIDRKLMTGWTAGDVVYIGLNNDWFTGRYSYILINTRVGNWVRASWSR